MKTLAYFILCVFIIHFDTKAQYSIDTVAKSNRLVPRFSVGGSRGLILEANMAFMFSRYGIAKTIKGTQVSNALLYAGLEGNIPFNRNPILGYKLGFESINVGHVTSYFSSEFIWFNQENKNSPALFLKLGIPLIHGGLAYGYGMYFLPDLRKEIGKHRVTLSWSLNKKSTKHFHDVLDKERRNFEYRKQTNTTN